MSREMARLTRYNLGGISVEDLMDPQHDPAGTDKDSRREYVQRIHSMMEVLQKEIKMAIGIQVDFNARYSENFDQTIFSRGGISMAEILLERWTELSNEHVQNVKEEQDKNKPFNQFNPAPETDVEEG